MLLLSCNVLLSGVKLSADILLSDTTSLEIPDSSTVLVSTEYVSSDNCVLTSLSEIPCSSMDG